MKLGDFRLYLISDGEIWLDGGAMFGVIPKPLWERRTQPDERNRICLGLNCLLVETPQARILIDTGCGFKYSPRELEIYRIEHRRDVPRELGRRGVAPEEIDFVVNTHYHFDHCGGNTHLEGEEVVSTFPRAVHLVRRREFEAACHPNERTRATYLAHNWEPIVREGRLRLVEEDEEIVPGVELVETPGHTAGHQSVRLSSGGRTLFYLADLCPTTAHVPLPWIMGYDLFPLTTLEVRRRIYRQALEEEWLLFFEHDPVSPLGRLREEKGRYRAEVLPWEEEPLEKP